MAGALRLMSERVPTAATLAPPRRQRSRCRLTGKVSFSSGTKSKSSSSSSLPSSPSPRSRALGLRARCAGEDGGDLTPDENKSVEASTADWRSFRAQLIQSEAATPIDAESGDDDESSAEGGLWAHAIGNRPEKGCLIIARPEAFLNSQRYFHEAVIFLVDYSPTKGAVGLILNRPTQFTLKAISFDITSPNDATDAPSTSSAEAAAAAEDPDSEAKVTIPGFLKDNRVYFGGDVKNASSTLMAVHPFDEKVIPGAQKVMEGVYCNGKWFELSSDKGPAVALDAPKYKFFAQYAGWAPGQLERELESNEVWITAACAPELVLKQVIQLTKPLWREVLELMGGEYAIMSKQQYGEL